MPKARSIGLEGTRGVRFGDRMEISEFSKELTTSVSRTFATGDLWSILGPATLGTTQFQLHLSFLLDNCQAK